MKTTQISKYYKPYHGGIETVVSKNAEALAKKGFNSSVISSIPSGLGSIDIINNVCVRRLSTLGEIYSTPISPTLTYHIRLRGGSSDICHYHIPNPASVLASGCGKLTNDNVVTYHSDIIKQKDALKYYRPALNTFLQEAEKIIVTSPHVYNNSSIIENFQHKTEILPLSVDTSEYTSTRSQKLVPEDKEPIELLFVGRLSYYKGVEYLIEAMEGVNALLTIVGDGKQREELESLSSDLNLEDKIRFSGRISDSKLHDQYDRSDIFVLPSVEESEAFGVVQLEAMAYATPVINTNLPTGVPWVSLDGKTGLTVPPRNVEKLREAIIKLVENSDLRHELGTNARRRVEEEFSDSKRHEHLYRLYDGLLNK